MPKIRENSRLMRTHDSPDPPPISANKSGSDQVGLQEKDPPIRKAKRGAPKNLFKILEDNNWDSVVDLVFRRNDDSCIMDALNSFGLEFGLPIMRALDNELSKDLIYSEDEEEILPAEPEAPESLEDADKPKALAREEKRAEKNKRKKLRRKERKLEWKKDHSANNLSDDDEEQDESKEEDSKEDENMVEKTCGETILQAIPENTAALTETTATGVGNDSKTTEQAIPESTAALTEITATGVGNDRKTTEQAIPESSAALTETTATGVGNDSKTTEQASPESSATLSATAATVVGNASKTTEQAIPENSATLSATAATGVGNGSKTTEQAIPENSATLSATAVTGVGNGSKTTEQASPESSATLSATAATGVGNGSKTTEQAIPENSATLSATAVTGVGNGSKTTEQASPESSVTLTATPGVENDSGSNLHEVESDKEPGENLKEVDKDSLDVSTAGAPVKNQLDETPKLLDETPKLEDKRKNASSPVVHNPEGKKSVQKKAKTEEKKQKKKKNKPSKTSEDHKETNNIEGCREMEESSVPSPLIKEAAVGGFSDNSGSNDDIAMTKEGDGNVEPTERNMEVVAEDLAKKSTELAAVGNRFAASGQYEEAVKCYTDAIKYNPQEFKLFGNRSLCYERMRDYERALADARLALFMEPKWLKGLFRKGKALCGLKRYFEASLVYKDILEQEGTSAEAAQELKRAQTLHLMEMGFTWGQSSEALKNHATLEEAIDALFGSEGRSRRSEGRRSQSVEHDDASEDKRNRLMEETEDDDKKRIAVGNNQPRIQKVNTPTPTPRSIDHARTKSQSPTPRDGVKTIKENCDLWVGSLAPTVTKMKLYSIFGRAGTVSNVTMISNQQYAFVKYNRKEDCDKAINMLNGMVVEGSPLLVRPSNRSRF